MSEYTGFIYELTTDIIFDETGNLMTLQQKNSVTHAYHSQY